LIVSRYVARKLPRRFYLYFPAFRRETRGTRVALTTNDSRRPWPDASTGSNAASYPTRPMTTGWELAPETPGSS